MWTDYRWEYPHFPRHLLEHLDTKQFWEWDFWKHPVGAGPYRFVRYEPQTMMEFETNPDFYAGKPRIGRVIAKFVGQGGLADLLAGNVDAITRVDPAWIPTPAADPRFRLYHSTDYPGFATIAWQHRDPLFRDVRVRRAMTLAINRRELAQLQHLPEDAPLADGPVTRRQLHRGELGEPLPYDPAQARALLDAAGWREQSCDGVRQREGVAFRFIVLATSQQTAVYVREQLRRVGVDMTLQIHDERQIREKMRTADFQAAIIGDSPLYNRWGLDDTNFARTRGLGYLNARVVELVNRSNVTVDPAEMDRIFAELREIFREEVPATYLTPFMRTSVAHRRIRGLSSPWRTYPFRLMDELSLDDANGS
ncbi:MAG: ABC transporter substrate-binding protein [Gemmatimonadaceae bacterium]